MICHWQSLKERTHMHKFIHSTRWFVFQNSKYKILYHSKQGIQGGKRERARGQFKQAAIGNISISSETLQRLRKMPRLRLNPKTAAVAAHKQPQNMALILWAHKPKNPVSIKLNATVCERERERENTSNVRMYALACVRVTWQINNGKRTNINIANKHK